MEVEQFIQYLQDKLSTGEIKPNDIMFAEWAEEWEPVSHIRRLEKGKVFIYTE